MNNPKNVMKYLLDMPKHKIKYIIHDASLVKGLWDNIKRYGVQYTKENHEILIEIVQNILEGPDIEREWTKSEYKNFVLYKGETKMEKCRECGGDLKILGIGFNDGVEVECQNCGDEYEVEPDGLDMGGMEWVEAMMIEEGLE